MTHLRPFLLATLLAAAPALASDPPARVGYDQHLDRPLPLDATFRDESGNTIRLGTCFGERPVILVLAYYGCPNLCTIVLNGLLQSIRDLKATAGEQFDVVVVSIDPSETPALAAEKKRACIRQYGRAGSDHGWHFLTGDAGSVRALTNAAGFRYEYHEASGQFAHPSGIVVATPAGRISQYLLGIDYPPATLAAAIDRARKNQPGSHVQNLLLLCFRYDPATGRYTLAITRILQVTGIGTVAVLAGIAFVLERRKRQTA